MPKMHITQKGKLISQYTGRRMHPTKRNFISQHKRIVDYQLRPRRGLCRREQQVDLKGEIKKTSKVDGKKYNYFWQTIKVNLLYIHHLHLKLYTKAKCFNK